MAATVLQFPGNPMAMKTVTNKGVSTSVEPAQQDDSLKTGTGVKPGAYINEMEERRASAAFAPLANLAGQISKNLQVASSAILGTTGVVNAKFLKLADAK